MAFRCEAPSRARAHKDARPIFDAFSNARKRGEIEVAKNLHSARRTTGTAMSQRTTPTPPSQRSTESSTESASQSATESSGLFQNLLKRAMGRAGVKLSTHTWLDSWSFALPLATPIEPSAHESLPRWKRVYRNLAAQDWLLTFYFMALALAVVFGSGPGRGMSLLRIGVDLAILWTGLAVVRGELLRPESFAGSLIYRLSLFSPVLLSYFQLRDILPAVSSRALDAEILELDLKLFGFEPALAWDHLVTPATTEWFSFFYFSYFAILMLFCLAFLLVVRDKALIARYSFGLFGIFCTAHLVYMLVPGYGPYKYLAGSFQNELAGGFFWRAVWDTVQAGGAMKDIFPSLHTAVPTFFTLFAWTHRDRLVFRLLFPVLAFFTSQIILATMFLRWHYLIDIVAGLTLASGAHIFSLKVQAWESALRARVGVASVFAPLDLPRLGRSPR